LLTLSPPFLHQKPVEAAIRNFLEFLRVLLERKIKNGLSSVLGI
jgi:hypothetical protein